MKLEGSVTAHSVSADRTPVVIGDGAWRYVVEPSWFTAPSRWHLGDLPGVAVAGDELYLFGRMDEPVAVLDIVGSPRVVRTWGTGEFVHPHAVVIVGDDVWCIDDGNHTVSRYTATGGRTMRLGTEGRIGESSGFHSGLPFARPTSMTVVPDGRLVITDGYHNHRVHVFTPGGELQASWGDSGVAAGEFNFPHAVVSDQAGRLYIADRENHRIQVFEIDDAGRPALVGIFTNLHRPSALAYDQDRGVLYVGEIGPVMRFNRGAPNLGPRVSVLATDGTVLARLVIDPGATPSAGTGVGQFLSPHAIAVDRQGALYVGEVAQTAWPQLFPEQEPPTPLRTIQRLTPVVGAA